MFKTTHIKTAMVKYLLLNEIHYKGVSYAITSEINNVICGSLSAAMFAY